ncbi:serine--tRNA ligase [Thermodesulfovibrionales bacterium]|nr:serine--tRNA ligase [Thermodesulfovibrionales bacterium]MCL0105751.1 serine--tRNA ligase [Thermodesulfovibrionales bacterium]
MLNIQLLRQNPEIVQEALAKRNDDAPINEILRLDKEERNLLQRIERLRARRNEVSRELERTKEKPPDLIADMRHIGELIRTLEQNEAQVSEQIRDMLLRMPNIPRLSVPHGKDGSDNVLVRSRGECRQFDFEPRPHWELGENLGIVDFERGVKLSGSRFYLLKGWGARMQRALINFMLDFHIKEHGYTEIYPPFMVKRECMVGSGNLPKFADNLYHDQEDDLWFVPTSEVPLTNLYRGEILPPGTLPIYHVAFTTCFRREKMSAGKDTRGIKRGHQFDKIELYKFVEPDTSDEELEKMVEDAAAVCSKLGLPYRIVELCTADLGFASAKSYDIEVWAPGCGEWLEVSSCSNCTDFQSRRANVRYRPEPGAKPEFAHTLNGSGMALPRILISVLENYQQSNGSVAVPEALRTYMGVDAIT